jgi:hypothetical protein
MTGLEIALLIVGAVLFVVSFFLPSGKSNEDKALDLTKEQVKGLVDKELENIKSPVQDIIDETITYAMEKGERAMDRLTNEKMMAISEYSDTVLKEINKNQQEVVFLYDMLNDKHAALLETVGQVNNATNAAKQVAPMVAVSRPAEELPVDVVADPSVFSPFVPPRVKRDNKRILKKKAANKAAEESVALLAEGGGGFTVYSETAILAPEMELVFEAEEDDDGSNMNELILEMHKEGKSYVDIARTLGLGIGEVRLVVDLFEES